MTNSRIPGFYSLPLRRRLGTLAGAAGLTENDLAAFIGPGLDAAAADYMVENAVGVHSLPLGIGLNFVVNGRDVLVPFAIEEPSVVAGASFMAKLARAGGGFTASADEPLMIGQMQVIDVVDAPEARRRILENKAELLQAATETDPMLMDLGGGARDLEVHELQHPAIGRFLAVHLIFDVRDAMGANAINTACEKLAPRLEAITGAKVHLRILSNLADRRLARASCTIPLNELSTGSDNRRGDGVRDGIIAAWAFAAADPYRAATHNKGIMNGVDAVVIATGNDWRAVEAGAHAYAARSGRYTSLSTWGRDESGNLAGTLEMPLAVGIVGGATRVHPGAQAALKLMGVHTARQLAEIIVSVGLAQNLAALRALATEGIQRGHMSLHARQLAIAAGAAGEQIERVASQMVAENVIRVDRATEILKSIR